MLADSRLNIYVAGADLSPRQRERIQAQLQTALRSLPPWVFELLQRRLQQLGAQNFPVVVEPAPRGQTGGRAFSLGHIEGRPAVRLYPRLAAAEIDWGQPLRQLLLKAAAYLAAPPPADAAFWQGWARAVQSDALRSKATQTGQHWAQATELDLLLEMFASCALNPEHARWRDLPAVRAFLREWAAPARPTSNL